MYQLMAQLMDHFNTSAPMKCLSRWPEQLLDGITFADCVCDRCLQAFYLEMRLSSKERKRRYEKAKQDLVAERKRLDLQAQGCQSPFEHEAGREHTCGIPDQRLKALREIRSAGSFFTSIASLPNELILEILGYNIRQYHSDVRIEQDADYSTCATRIFGNIPEGRNMQDHCRQALLSNAVHRLGIDFQGVPSHRIAVLPSSISRGNVIQIRHLEMSLEVLHSHVSTVYPARIYKAIDAMGSLITQLRLLRTLRILIVSKAYTTRELPDLKCHRRNCAGTTTMSEVIDSLRQVAERPKISVSIELQGTASKSSEQ